MTACGIPLDVSVPTEEESADMPLSGEDLAIGYHDDKDGYHIVNRIEFAQHESYAPKKIAHSYQSLPTDAQRQLYETILDAAYCFSDVQSRYDGEFEMRPVILSGTEYERKDVEAPLVAVIDDHPEIFWMATDFDLVGQSGSDTTQLILNAYYTAESVIKMMEKIDSALSQFYAQMPSDLTPYEREVMVYKYIIGNCVYDENISSSETYSDEHPSLFNLYGVTVDHKAVCEGYAYTFDYLCSALGIDTVCICGVTDSESDKDVGDASSDLHIWNAVELDGEWYMVDCTWDDLDDDEDYGGVFTYLNITDEVLKIDHTIDKTYAQISDEEYAQLTSFINNYLPPACTATKYCYYLNESVHLTAPDAGVLADGIVQAVERGRTSVMICIDSDAYTPDTMSQALFEGSQPYYEAMETADARLSSSPLAADADAVYYPIYDLNMLVFKLNYE